MKVKMISLMFVVVLTVVGICNVGLAAGNAVDFTDGWKGCTPLLVGPSNGDVMVKLSCASESGWAILSTTGTDQMMASILTAMSLNKPVSVLFNGRAAENTPVAYEYSKVDGIQLSMQ